MKRTFLLIIAIFLFAAPVCAFDRGFFSYIEKAPNGEIDWNNGYFYGIGLGYPHLNDGSKSKAVRVAQAGALSAILQVAAKVRVDDRFLLRDLERKKLIIQIKGLVRYEPYKRVFVKKGPHPFYRVTYRAPLNGVEGLTSRLLNQLRTRASTWKDLPQPGRHVGDDSTLPWLVLDARGIEKQTQVRPALFPKIVTDKGETIYEVKDVDEAALKKRGMARYVVSDRSRDELASCPAQIPWNWLLDLVSPDAAQAQEKQKRKKRGKYIIKDVQGVQGLMKTNVVISESDANSIRQEDASHQVLKKCRVIVIASSSLGGIEGKVFKYFALGR
jgi:hypothetical protein